MMSFTARIVSGVLEDLVDVALAHVFRLAQHPDLRIALAVEHVIGVTGPNGARLAQHPGLFPAQCARCRSAAQGRRAKQNSLLKQRFHHGGGTVAGGKLTRESTL